MAEARLLLAANGEPLPCLRRDPTSGCLGLVMVFSLVFREVFAFDLNRDRERAKSEHCDVS